MEYFMMNKWVDYVITEVRYNNERSHIVAFKCWRHIGAELIGPDIRSRADIINAIDNENLVFITEYKDEDGKWEKGGDVGIVTVGNEKFLRTDTNPETRDNLGNLPEL